MSDLPQEVLQPRGNTEAFPHATQGKSKKGTSDDGCENCCGTINYRPLLGIPELCGPQLQVREVRLQGRIRVGG